MKVIKALVFLCFVSMNCYGQGSLKKMKDFPGVSRDYEISFTIGSQAYTGTGISNETFPTIRLKDFWRYSPVTDTWSQVADLPADGRGSAIAFVIDTKAYVGMGDGGNGVYFNDLWEYNSVTNVWSQKNSLPSNARSQAIGWALNGKGYAGLGSDGISFYYKDFWQYDPSLDQWTRKKDFPGETRYSRINFAINGKGYFGFGERVIPNIYNDLWEYDPLNDSWTEKANMTSIGLYYRNHMAGVVLGNKAYLILPGALGFSGNGFQIAIYDPVNDAWEKGSIIDKYDSEAPGVFAINGKMFFSLNETSNSDIVSIYEFNPNALPSTVTLTAITISTSRIDLSWNDEATDEEKYEIYRSTTSNSGFVKVAEVAANITTYQDQGLNPDITYYYKIKAVNITKSFESDFSNEVNATTTLIATINLQPANTSTSEIQLTWTTNNNIVDGYSLERSDNGGLNYQAIDSVAANIFVYLDTNLEADKIYYYRMRAFQGKGFSQYSNEASATTSLNANISLQAFSQSLSAVRLAWSSDNAIIDGYKIERSEDEAQGYTEITEIPVASAAGHIDQNLEPGKTYFYRIRAFRGTSFSEYSNRIGANTLVTGINNSLTQQIKVLNNPNTTGIFQIKTEGLNIQNWQVKLRDGQMKALPKNLVLKNNAGYQIDLRQKASGVYFIIFDTPKGKAIRKLWKH